MHMHSGTSAGTCTYTHALYMHVHVHVHYMHISFSQNVLLAVSQSDTAAYFPYVNKYESDIRSMVEEFLMSHVLPQLKELENYVVDFYVTPDKVTREKTIYTCSNGQVPYQS